MAISQQPVVVRRRTVEPSLNEGDVEDGAVEVNKLEHVHLEGESVLVLSLCPVHLWDLGCETQTFKGLTRNSYK